MATRSLTRIYIKFRERAVNTTGKQDYGLRGLRKQPAVSTRYISMCVCVYVL